MASNTVILTGQGNYTTWLRSLKSSAWLENVWDLITGTEEIMAEPKLPAMPDLHATRRNATGEELDTEVADAAVEHVRRHHELSCLIYEDGLDDYYKQRDRVVLANTLIWKSLDNWIFDSIPSGFDPNVTFDRIKEEYKPTKARILHDAHKRLAALKLWHCDGMINFIYQADCLRRDITDEGDTYSDSQFAFKIMSSLGRGYEGLLKTWQFELDRPNAPVPTLENLRPRLLAEELTIKTRKRGGRSS